MLVRAIVYASQSQPSDCDASTTVTDENMHIKRTQNNEKNERFFFVLLSIMSRASSLFLKCLVVWNMTRLIVGISLTINIRTQAQHISLWPCSLDGILWAFTAIHINARHKFNRIELDALVINMNEWCPDPIHIRMVSRSLKRSLHSIKQNDGYNNKPNKISGNSMNSLIKRF